MDICIDCKVEQTKTILRCVDCDDKLKIKIKNRLGIIGIGHLTEMKIFQNNKLETTTKYFKLNNY